MPPPPPFISNLSYLFYVSTCFPVVSNPLYHHSISGGTVGSIETKPCFSFLIQTDIGFPMNSSTFVGIDNFTTFLGGVFRSIEFCILSIG